MISALPSSIGTNASRGAVRSLETLPFVKGVNAPVAPVSSCFCACYSECAAYTPGAAVAKLAYAAGLKSAGDFPVVGSTPTSRTILTGRCRKRAPSAPGSCWFSRDSYFCKLSRPACHRDWASLTDSSDTAETGRLECERLAEPSIESRSIRCTVCLPFLGD